MQTACRYMQSKQQYQVYGFDLVPEKMQAGYCYAQKQKINYEKNKVHHWIGI